MSLTPKGINTINTALQTGFLAELVKAGKVKDPQVTSAGTVRFDLLQSVEVGGAKINRIRMTAREDGTLDVQLMEVIEHDLIGGVPPISVGQALANIGIKP